MSFLVLILFVFLIFYTILIIRYVYGWISIKKKKSVSFFPKVSVIIAMRNEQNKVYKLCHSLNLQNYSSNKLEFIIVNDHSTDDTLSCLKKVKLDNLRLLDMPDGQSGKKSAIKMGVTIANGDIILVSDADCFFTKDWVSTMVSYFETDKVQLVSGPVCFHKKQGLFQIFQALEFISLIGSGAGAIGVEDAIFCNGANMAYRKETFLKLNHFIDDKIVSGDDVFLLHAIKQKYYHSIVFAKERGAIVHTESTQNYDDFINQRKRWVAKSSLYKDRASIYTSYLVFFTNLSLFLLFLLQFFDARFCYFFLIFYLVKCIVDYSLLLPVLRFFQRKDLAKWILFFELFYSFYIILIVILSFIKDFEWKGRRHKK